MNNKIKVLFQPNRLIAAFIARFFTWLPEDIFLRCRYRLLMHKKLHLDNPVMFTEKIQWLKLYDRKDVYTRMADKYDVTAEESIERANARVKHSTEEAFAETVQGYNSVTAENSSVQFHNGKAKYALYPVWLLNTTWNGNKYTFAMNGQTGKFVGDLPVDKAAATRWTAILAVAFTAVTYGAATLLHFIGLF